LEEWALMIQQRSSQRTPLPAQDAHAGALSNSGSNPENAQDAP